MPMQGRSTTSQSRRSTSRRACSHDRELQTSCVSKAVSVVSTTNTHYLSADHRIHYCAPALPASNLCLDRINHIVYNLLPRRRLTLASSASSGTEIKPCCPRVHHLPGGKFGSADSTYKDSSRL